MGLRQEIAERLLKVFGRSSEEAAKEAAKAAARVEPTLAKDAAEAAAKKVDNTVNFEKTDASTLGGAKKTFDARQSAAKEATPAAIDIAAETVVKAGERLGYRQAQKILTADNQSIASKLIKFTAGQRDDYSEKLLLIARKDGMKAGDIDLIRKADLPKDLIKKFEALDTLQTSGSKFAKMADSLKATAMYRVTHPVSTAWEALVLPFTAAGKAIITAKNNPIATTATIGAGTVGMGALHVVTGGASSAIAGSFAGGIVSGYASVYSGIGTGVYDATKWGLSKIDPEAAANLASNAAVTVGGAIGEAAGASPDAAATFWAAATGQTLEDARKDLEKVADLPLVGSLLPNGLKQALTLDRMNKKAHTAQDLPHGQGLTAPAVTVPAVDTGSASDKAKAAADAAKDAAAGARDGAEAAADGALDKLAELNASMGPMAVLKDPKRALSALRDMPGMSELVDKAKDYPLLSLGLIGGMIMGGFTDAHSKTEKIGNILKGAMLFGVILDAISWFTGGKSMIANSVKMVQQELNQPPKPAAVPAPAVDTPAAPALTTQAPATPAPAPVAVAPLVTREPSVIASTFNNGAVVAAAVAAPVIALPANTAVQPAIAYQGPTTKDLQSGDTTNLGALAFKPAVANAPVFGENQVASVHEKPKPKDVFLTAPEPSFG